MVDFIEAVDTINDPDSDYLILREDGDYYIFDVDQQSTPIEAGSFYKYSDGYNDDPDIVIDEYAISLNEYEPDPLARQAYTKFPKSQFDLGSNYSNVTYSNLPLQDPISVTTAHRNNMTYNSSVLPDGLYTMILVSNSQLQMTSSNYSGSLPCECYYIADNAITPSNPFTVYLPTGESFIINYTTWFFKVTSFTESD